VLPTTSAPVAILQELPIERISPSEINPRRHFDEEGLRELSDSLASVGMIEPIIVRPSAGQADRFSIIAGERRYRAALLAGLATVPVRIWSALSDAQALEIALIENLHRTDLNPLDEARAYQTLNRVVGLKQAQIAAAVHRSQPVIANRMRLLDLPEDVQERIRIGELSVAHGVALARYKAFPQVASVLAAGAVEDRLSSAQLEADPTWRGIGGLERANAAVGLRQAHFDRAVCHKCPFSAYRASWQGGEYCLKPEHFAELQAEADAGRLATSRAVVATAEAAGQTVVKVDELTYGTYERCGSYGAPTACSEACPCRAVGLERGGSTSPICTDPKRWARLRRQETHEANREQNERRAEFLATSCAVVDQLVGPSSRELALFLASTAGEYANRAAFKKALDRHAPRLAIDQETNGWEDRHWRVTKALATLPVDVLVRVGLETLLRAQAESLTTQPSKWVHWYVGAAERRAAAEPNLDARIDAALKGAAAPVVEAQRRQQGPEGTPSAPNGIEAYLAAEARFAAEREPAEAAKDDLVAAGILQPPPRAGGSVPLDAGRLSGAAEVDFEGAPAEIGDLTDAYVNRDDLSEAQRDRIIAVVAGEASAEEVRAELLRDVGCARCGRAASDLAAADVELLEFAEHGLVCGRCAMDLDDVDAEDFRAKQTVDSPQSARKRGRPRKVQLAAAGV
jgi:ParB/RepB/Spo0J family partition protein